MDERTRTNFRGRKKLCAAVEQTVVKPHVTRCPAIVPGLVFWQRRGRQKCRVVAVLSDETDPQVVYKYFGYGGQGWRYEVQSLYSFTMFLEEGCYTTKRKRGGA